MDDIKVNTKKLRQLLRAKGKRGIAIVAIEADVSTSVLEKLSAGTYPTLPKIEYRERICNALGVHLNEIFVPVGAGKKTAS